MDNTRLSPARRAGQQKFAKTQPSDAGFLQVRKKQEAVNLEKTMRLRALRLEKEAADRLQAGPEPTPKPRQKTKTFLDGSARLSK
jgi:hypothetical protein